MNDSSVQLTDRTNTYQYNPPNGFVHYDTANRFHSLTYGQSTTLPPLPNLNPTISLNVLEIPSNKFPIYIISEKSPVKSPLIIPIAQKPPLVQATSNLSSDKYAICEVCTPNFDLHLNYKCPRVCRIGCCVNGLKTHDYNWQTCQINIDNFLSTLRTICNVCKESTNTHVYYNCPYSCKISMCVRGFESHKYNSKKCKKMLMDTTEKSEF